MNINIQFVGAGTSTICIFKFSNSFQLDKKVLRLDLKDLIIINKYL
jgi:hypothetical protein